MKKCIAILDGITGERLESDTAPTIQAAIDRAKAMLDGWKEGDDRFRMETGPACDGDDSLARIYIETADGAIDFYARITEVH